MSSCAVCVREEFGLPEDCPLCIHVGRFFRAKNHVRLIEIFAELSRLVPDARMLLVGRTNEDEDIEEAVHNKVVERGLVDRVVLAGERTDVPRLVKASDLMLFPSLWEGLPGAVLEGGAAGIPVLSSDVPGAEEIALHLPLVECLSLNASDAEWASRAQEMIGPDQETREQAQRAFEATEFNVGAYAEKLCAVWRQARDGKCQG